MASKASSTKKVDKSKIKTPRPVKFTKEEELSAYRDMLLIRRFEEKAGQLYGMGFIGGFCHLLHWSGSRRYRHEHGHQGR